MLKNNIKLDFSDVLIEPKPSRVGSRNQVNLDVEYPELNFVGIPIVAANMDTIGTFAVAKVLSEFKMITCLKKQYTKEDYQKNDYDSKYVIASMGIQFKDISNLQSILEYNSNIKYICIDVANGYTSRNLEVVDFISNKYKDKIIIAGNVATKDGIENLKIFGANIIKVGIGSGSVCTTRHMTGVGVPQLSAILDCPKSISIMSDGGCTNPGDIAKAFVAGAKFVMLGGMLAGHDETCEEYYGMSSKTAMIKYLGGVADYKTAEGKHVNLPKRGKLKDTILNILGGLRSTCAYTDCFSLNELIGNETINLIKVHRQANEIFV